MYIDNLNSSLEHDPELHCNTEVWRSKVCFQGKQTPRWALYLVTMLALYLVTMLALQTPKFGKVCWLGYHMQRSYACPSSKACYVSREKGGCGVVVSLFLPLTSQYSM